MKVNDIRKSFLEFFKDNGHYIADSFPLVPINDDSLLLINAGMAPLKNYFLGIETPPSKRMATCQKCIRTGDIDNVGKTARHATFFEMLGNFSFGDYFKKEAIGWAWKFVTEYLKLDKSKLWVTVYEEDDDALEIWANEQNIPRERIVKLGKKDNFWEIGTGTGPSGPCSEIYIDRGDIFNCENPDCKPGCDCDRFLEFWNLVFTQFNKDESGEYIPLDFPNIDTGMGLERIACIMQGVDSIFDIDTMVKIRDKVCFISSKEYGESEKNDISIRIITDHCRAITFLLSDGVIPSNEGRGYILRRLLRRAARHGKLLGIDREFLTEVSNIVIQEYKEAYPELDLKSDYINKLITIEEKKFQETIDQGLNILENNILELNKEGKDTLSGLDAFKLYDTFGFPLEITIEILEENGKKVDLESFNKHMEEQRNLARNARSDSDNNGWKKTALDEIPEDITVEFTGYDDVDSYSCVKYIIKNGFSSNNLVKGDEAYLILDKTPFYGEGGGQIGDIGKIHSNSFSAIVKDTKKTSKGLIAHIIFVEEGELKLGDNVKAEINNSRRKDIAKNHSATHLLHKALKKVLGNHVSQAGSLVDDNKLRFDFSHFEALTKDEIKMVEKIVNEQIFNQLNVTVSHMPINEAKAMGAAAQFDEKYGDIVRVIQMGDYSIELCGGTHVDNTIDIMMFKILNESSVASGIRRIEAITGRKVYDYLLEKELKIDNITDILKTTASNVEDRAEQLIKDLKNTKKEVESLKQSKSNEDGKKLFDKIEEINGIKLLITEVEDKNVEEIKSLAQGIVDKYDDAVVLVGSIINEKIVYVSICGKVAVEKGAHAGNIVKSVAAITGGGGGGKPSFAQAGGKDIEKFNNSLIESKSIILDLIRG